jgi:type IV pilus assembly protein PilO
MSGKFSKRDLFIVMITTLLLVVIILYLQYFYLVPLKNDLAIKQENYNSEEKILNTIGQQIGTSKTVSLESTSALQQKVPVKPMQGQIILNLQMAETISNSQIKTMSFSTVDQAVESSSTTQTSNNQTQASSGTGNQAASNLKSSQSIPSGIKKLTLQLSVESPSYDEFETFISTLESLKRIVVVDSISYNGNQEITSLAEDSQPFDYNLTLSAFYMPGLTDLQAQLPKIVVPAPANKENPLSAFADIQVIHKILPK